MLNESNTPSNHDVQDQTTGTGALKQLYLQSTPLLPGVRYMLTRTTAKQLLRRERGLKTTGQRRVENDSCSHLLSRAMSRQLPVYQVPGTWYGSVYGCTAVAPVRAFPRTRYYRWRPISNQCGLFIPVNFCTQTTRSSRILILIAGTYITE